MTGRRAFWLPAVLIAALIPGSSGAAPVGPGSVGQDALSGSAERFARDWSRGNAAGIAGLLSGGTVRVHLEGVSHPSLSPRSAEAALREYFSSHRAGGVRIARVSEVGGAPPRGYVEIDWETVASGTSESLRLAVFAGFVLEEGRWRVTEIRVLR